MRTSRPAQLGQYADEAKRALAYVRRTDSLRQQLPAQDKLSFEVFHYRRRECLHRETHCLTGGNVVCRQDLRRHQGGAILDKPSSSRQPPELLVGCRGDTSRGYCRHRPAMGTRLGRGCRGPGVGPLDQPRQQLALRLRRMLRRSCLPRDIGHPHQVARPESIPRRRGTSRPDPAPLSTKGGSMAEKRLLPRAFSMLSRKSSFLPACMKMRSRKVPDLPGSFPDSFFSDQLAPAVSSSASRA